MAEPLPDTPPDSGQPSSVWRQRHAIAVLVLVVVLFGISPFFLVRFVDGISLWVAISGVWATGICLTWAGGRIQKSSGAAGSESDHDRPFD